MILEIKMKNFRSVNDEQVLRFYTTGTQGGNLGNVVPLTESLYRALKSVALYGANGSGKTNVLRAIWAVRMLIGNSYRLGEEEEIPWFDPCIFHDSNDGEGSRFEVEFTAPVEEGREVRFLYRIEFNNSEVFFESLSSFARGREAVLFLRNRGDDKNTMSFGASLKGGDRKIGFFKNQAYLSVAGRSPSSPVVLRAVYRYFKKGMMQIRLQEVVPAIYRHDKIKAQKLVRYVDLGVTDIEVRENDLDETSVHFPKDMPLEIRQQLISSLRKRYYFTHSAGGNVTGQVELAEESDGTQRLFRLFPGIVDTLVRGGVYIIDEIESGMHPFMAETIVRLFNDPELNEGQSQLLFTTHDSTLLTSNLMRRDQIWFSEKVDGCSTYYSLDDFDKKTVTPTSPFARWYLEGRFGAIPNIDYSGLVNGIKAIKEEVSTNENA